MEREKKLTRRSLLKTSAVAAGAILAGAPAAASLKPSDGATIVIDCHAHLHHHGNANYAEKDRQLIEAADKLGIDRLCCSILTPVRPATADGFRECNRWLAEAAARFSDRVWGYCYVNPEHGKEAVDEIRRCVDERGFIGVKLYNERVCTDPVVAPVVEAAIALGVPILQHAGHAHYPLPGQPNISDGGHLAELGRRYPEARLICRSCRRRRRLGVDDQGPAARVERLSRHQRQRHRRGNDRDGRRDSRRRPAALRLRHVDDGRGGKIRAARLDAESKRKIFGGNMNRLLATRNKP